MLTHEIIEQLKEFKFDNHNPKQTVTFDQDFRVEVYPNSINFKDLDCFFIGCFKGEKYLWKLSAIKHVDNFTGEQIPLSDKSGYLLKCPLNHPNAEAIRSLFDFTRPVLIGLDDSFGFGDRFGIANPAHLRSLARSKMRPLLAQQSIRELERTQREAEEVIDAATWAVFQEGFKNGYGADADHLKTIEDIDRMVKAGFTFFTFDPGDFVVNEADTLSMAELQERCKSLPWDDLKTSLDEIVAAYDTNKFEIADDFILKPDKEQILRALVKYGGVLAHTVKMCNHLKETYPEHPAEFELSVDETESVTSPFEHFMVVNELKRLGVKLVSLAPRFVGEFEKGIDYKGNLDEFKEEYIKHMQIARMLGPYKISIHSGSDKFSVYKVIGSLKQGQVHVKTAGTSYLEALRTVAKEDPGLFREILDLSRVQYEIEKQTYHVSAKLENVPASDECTDSQLLDLFERDDARQVLHVTYGKVLTMKTHEGHNLFKDRIFKCLNENENTHYEYLRVHFHRHIKPFLS